MRKFLLLILLATPAFAGGPKYTYKTPPGLDDEMQNVYHDIKYQNGISVTDSTGTFAYLSVSTVSAISGTFGTGTFTTLSVGGSTNLGKIKQIKQCTSTTTTSTTSTSFVDTSLTCPIIPTATTSSITVVAIGIVSLNINNRDEVLSTISNGSTDLLSGAGCDSFINVNGATAGVNFVLPCSMSVLNFPNSTSLQTYKVRLASPSADSVSWGHNSYLQTMILTEYGS